MTPSGTGSHICPDCPPLSPRFDSSSTLLHHIHEAHPFPKRFRCEGCGEAYARSWSLSRHKRACRPSIPDFDAFSVFSSSEDERLCSSPVSEQDCNLIDNIIDPSKRQTLKLKIPKTRGNSERTERDHVCGTHRSFSVDCLTLNALQVYSQQHRLSQRTLMQRMQKRLENLVSAQIRNKMASHISSLRTLHSQRQDNPASPTVQPIAGAKVAGKDEATSTGLDNGNPDAEHINNTDPKWIAAIIASWIEELCLAIILKRALFIAFLLLCLHALEHLVPNTFKFNNLLGTIAGDAVVHMSYLVPISIMVLWGVCWMFDRPGILGIDPAGDMQFETAFEEFTQGGDFYTLNTGVGSGVGDSGEDDRIEVKEEFQITANPGVSDVELLSNYPDDMGFERSIVAFAAVSETVPHLEGEDTMMLEGDDHNTPPGLVFDSSPLSNGQPISPSDGLSGTASSPDDNSATSQSSSRVSTSKRFTCDHCGTTFGHAQSLSRHKRNKHGNGADKCPVPGCTRRMRKDNVMRHMGTAHPLSYEDHQIKIKNAEVRSKKSRRLTTSF